MITGTGVHDRTDQPFKITGIRTLAFYSEVMAERPLFLIGNPYDGKRAAPGNGQMAALLAPSRDAVDKCIHRLPTSPRLLGLRKPKWETKHIHYAGIKGKCALEVSNPDMDV